MNDFGESIIVEAYFSGARITGLLRNATQNRRLVDVLNNQDLTFELHTPQVRMRNDDGRGNLASMLLSKAGLIYAVPRETEVQVRRRAMNRTGVTLSNDRMEAYVLLDSVSMRGIATLPAAMSRTRLEIAMFSRFIAFTDVTISQPDGSTVEEQVVVVNLDRIAALGRYAAAA